MNVKALFDIFSLSAAALCSSMKTVIWPMSSTKKRLWQRMGTKRPNWKEFLEISHLRWGNGDTKPGTQSPLFSLLIKIFKKSFWCVAGNYKAGPSVHPCRFPSCHLWSLTTCPGSSHTSRRVNSVPWLSFSWKPELPFEISTTIFKCDVLMWTCLMLSLCMWCLGLWTDTVQVTSGRGKERCQSVDLSSLADCGLRACVFWYVCKMEPDSPEFGCCHLIFFLWFTELQTLKGKVMGSFSSHL